MKKTCLILLVLAIVLFLPQLTSAKQSSVQTTEVGQSIQIEYPKISTFQYNGTNSIELSFHVYNNTGHELSNSTTSCSFHIFNNMGEHIISNASLSFDSHAGTSGDFFYNISNTALERNSEYSYIVYCNNTEQQGFVSVPFSVNEIGKDPDTFKSPQGIGNMILFYVLAGCMFVLLGWYFNSISENSLLKIVVKYFTVIIPLLLVLLGSRHLTLAISYAEDIGFSSSNFVSMGNIAQTAFTIQFWAFMTFILVLMIVMAVESVKALAQKKSKPF